MPHDPLHACCTVYVWLPTVSSLLPYLLYRPPYDVLLGRVGHAAIKVSDGRGGYAYLSYWGDRNPAGPGSNSITHLANAYKAAGTPEKVALFIARDMTKDPQAVAGAEPIFDDEPLQDGQKPDYRCRILRGLNFAEMLKEAKEWRKGNSSIGYDWRKSNCCHAVANVLKAGNPPGGLALTGYITNTWIPHNIRSYCVALAEALNGADPTSATQNTGSGWRPKVD